MLDPDLSQPSSSRVPPAAKVPKLGWSRDGFSGPTTRQQRLQVSFLRYLINFAVFMIDPQKNIVKTRSIARIRGGIKTTAIYSVYLFSFMKRGEVLTVILMNLIMQIWGGAVTDTFFSVSFFQMIKSLKGAKQCVSLNLCV